MWPLSLPSKFRMNASRGQRRAAATVFAKSLILTMRKMQQSKYREVMGPIFIAWIHRRKKVRNSKILSYSYNYMHQLANGQKKTNKNQRKRIHREGMKIHTSTVSLLSEGRRNGNINSVTMLSVIILPTSGIPAEITSLK